MRVRRSRLEPQNWEPCWQELKKLDKYRGAGANPDIERSFLEGFFSDDDSDDTDDEEGDTGDAIAGAGSAARAEDGGRRPRVARGPALLERSLIRRKALKRRLSDDNAEAASLVACDKSMRVVAQSSSRPSEMREEAQKLEQQRMAIKVFNRPETKNPCLPGAHAGDDGSDWRRARGCARCARLLCG